MNNHSDVLGPLIRILYHNDMMIVILIIEKRLHIVRKHCSQKDSLQFAVQYCMRNVPILQDVPCKTAISLLLYIALVVCDSHVYSSSGSTFLVVAFHDSAYFGLASLCVNS